MAEYWEDEDGEPLELGIPVTVVVEPVSGISNLCAFAEEADGAERAVIDWDHGKAMQRHASFRAFLESQLALERRAHEASTKKTKKAAGKSRPVELPKDGR